MNALAHSTTMVVGASRGLGRGIATALADAGAPVIAVARSRPALAELADTTRTSAPRSPTRPTRQSPAPCWTATSRAS